MPVESADDLASFFDEEEFAEAATYLAPDDGAEAVACSVIVDRGQGAQLFRAGETSAATAERLLHVRKSEVPLVKREGVFTLDVDGEQLKVREMPVLDQTGLWWTAKFVLVD